LLQLRDGLDVDTSVSARTPRRNRNIGVLN
jgi:hypothetical protein